MVARRRAGYPQQPPAITKRRKTPDSETGWSVELTPGGRVPITDAEIRVLELYLGKQLDALFGGEYSSQDNIAAESDEAMKLPIQKQG
jgi:hypothetical protein